MPTAEELLKLRQESERVAQLRADAEAAVKLARQQLAQTDAELRQLGVDPEHCEQELAAMETKLAQEIAALRAKLAEEVRVYHGILEAAQRAGLR